MEPRKTFVIWVSRTPAGAGLEGRLEEVDSGLELRFRSAEQLIAMLEDCLVPVKEEE